MHEFIGFILVIALCVGVGFGTAYGIYVVNPDHACRRAHDTYKPCQMVWVPAGEQP